MAMTHRSYHLLLAASLAGLAALPATPLAAQGRAVVQPLPPAASAELNRALRRLNTNARDVDALILAGEASLELGDIDAAIGFFGRAEELSRDNPRVKAGTAAAYVRVQRPVEALRLFEEAERAGVRPASVAGDKGLAHDLVGANREAQIAYRRSLSYQEDAEIRRRMALSYAIAGDREAFESTLLPLLEQRDFAAYRTRSFGLAILGEPDEAVAIAEAVMPQQMSERVEPYLRYMRRLTPAQQAAAANLGIFPRAAAIGRDDPRIVAAREAGSAPALAGVDTGLAPAGRALGSSAPTRTTPTADSAAARDGASPELTREQRAAVLERRRERGRFASRSGRRVRLAETEPQASAPEQPVSSPAQAPAAQAVQAAPMPTGGELPALAQAASPAATVPAPARDDTPQPLSQIAVAPSQAASAPATNTPQDAVTVATLGTETPAPGFDLGDVASANAEATADTSGVGPDEASAPVQIAAATPAPTAASVPVSATPPQPAPSVSDAFADLMALPQSPATSPGPDAVDITAIAIPREEEAEPIRTEAAPEPEPQEPVNASRIWVQIATGRDRSALRFDWRRFARQAPDVLGDNGPYVAAWGQTNRLLAGPFESRTAANSAVNALAEKGIGAFRFTSAAGQVIDELD